MKLRLPAACASDVARHGEAAYPHECCGFLLGRTEADLCTVASVREALNAAESLPERRYRITPDVYRGVEREAAAAGWDIVGFYHSHPDHPARPSPTDLAEAWPNMIYVIVPVRGGAAGEATAWVLADDRESFAAVALSG